MIYTCPKCGKKLDLTTETLINSEYKVICPQCLCKLQIVGDFAYIPHDELELDTTVLPSHTINCPKCGHEASSGAHFCPNCGTSFDTSTPPMIPDAIEDATVLPPPVPGTDPLYQEAIQFLQSCTAITFPHFPGTRSRAHQAARGRRYHRPLCRRRSPPDSHPPPQPVRPHLAAKRYTGERRQQRSAPHCPTPSHGLPDLSAHLHVHHDSVTRLRRITP